MKQLGMMVGLCTLAACDGASLVDALGTSDSELQAAQCANVAQNDCFTTFEACTSDAATCEAALRACLPPPPAHADGGQCHGGGGRGDGGHAGPRPSGGGHHGGGRPPLSETCRAALETCIDAAPAEASTCFDAARTCMQAEFQARCDEAAVSCEESTDDACTRILARCAAGVNTVPTGTSCDTAAAVE